MNSLTNIKKDAFAEFHGCGWIWYDNYGYDDVNVFMYAKKIFTLECGLDRAEIKITADSRYKLYVNGEYASYGPARGFLNSYPFDRVEINKYLKAGANSIAVIVWQWGHSTFQSVYGGAAGLLVSGEIGGVDVGTKPNNGWIVKKCSGRKQDMIRRSLHLGYQEEFDGRMEEEWMRIENLVENGKGGWCPGRWKAAGSLPWTGLEERGIPQLSCEVNPCSKLVSCRYGDGELDWKDRRNLTELYLSEKKAAKSVLPPPDYGKTVFHSNGYYEVPPIPENKILMLVFDFGEENVGFIGMEMEGAGGEVFDFTSAEMIEKGALLVQSTDYGSKVAVSDRYISREGRQTFESFSIHGFRYLSLTIRNVKKPLKIHSVYVRSAIYPFKEETFLKTSDDTINNIWRMCVRTQRCCSLDSYVDSPWREQAQWCGDSRVQAANTYYLWGDMRLFRRGVRQFGQSQLPSGLVPGVAPSSSVGLVLPDYTLLWIHSHLDYYKYTGDKSLMREQYKNIKKAIKFFISHVAENHLLGNMPQYWVFLDWAPLYKDGFSCYFNLLFLSALHAASEISVIVGRAKDAEYYNGHADEILGRIVRVFWDKKTSVFCEGYDPEAGAKVFLVSQHSHALAVLLGLKKTCHGDWAENIFLPPMRLEPLVSRDVIEASPYFYYYVIEALKKIGGYEGEIVEFIRRRWGRMIREGATGCHEQWHIDKGTTSLCHAWSAHPVIHLVEIIGGKKPAGHLWSNTNNQKVLKDYPAELKLWNQGRGE